jgi:HK97 family phage major capsid protein
MPTDLLTETPIEADPFAPATRSNPGGTMYREVTIEREAGQTEAALRVAISSEAAVLRYDWRTDEEYLEVLDHGPEGPDLSYAQDGLPFLRDHRLEDQIGLLQDVSLDADRRLRGTLTQGNHPDAAWLFADMRSGVRKKVSIGYWPGATYTQEKNAAGQLVRRYRGWMIYEASTVTVPADYDVGVGRGAPGRAPTPSDIPAVADEAPKKERSMAVDNASERGVAPAPDTRPEQLAVLAREGGLTERLADWISNGVTVEQARTEVIRTLREKATAPAVVTPAPVVQDVHNREQDRPFGSLVDQLRAIKRAADGPVDPRLHGVMRGAPSGLGEQVGADGGYLIAPQFATNIFQMANDGGEILSRVTEIPVSGNQYVMPAVDETARTNGNRFGGVRVFRGGENDTANATRPKYRRVALDLTKKLIGVCYVTEEQLEDAPATSMIVEQAFSSELRFAKEREVWEGNGTGEMLGWMNSGALVTQAAEAGQTAGTIVAPNITKMWARLHPSARANAVWYINQDAEPQLPLMTIGNWPVYVPPTGLSGSRYGTLYNRPVVAVEFASTIGQVGDIVLADPSFFALGVKGGAKMQRSIHVRFIQGEETFRFTERCDGQPMLAAPITPFKGSNTQSAFVALAAR